MTDTAGCSDPWPPGRLAAETAFQPGDTVSHFEIVGPLGRGGRGVVYKARDLKLGRFVALKFLPPELSSDPEEKRRLLQEAQMASALDHPNVCAVHAVEEAPDGRLFIAMSFYEGEPLSRRIARGPVPLSELAEIGLQVAAGLEAAHQRGVIHRDVKPGNLLRTPEGVVKILDFGLSKRVAAVSDLTRTGMILGTVAYMSPEQARGEALDGRTDLWSLGVVLFELATGRRPFVGDSELAVLVAVAGQDLDPAAVAPELPPALLDILRRCLARDRERRYPDAASLAADLRALRAPTSGSASGPTRALSRALPPVRPAVWRGARAAVAGLGLAVVSLVALWFARGALRSPSDSPAPPSRAPAVVFVGIAAVGLEAADAWRATALAELLSQELELAPGFADVRRREIQAAVEGPGAGGGEGLDAEARELVARFAEADRLLSGAVRPGATAGAVEAVLVVQDRSGAVVARTQREGTGDRPDRLAADLAQGLAAALGLPPAGRQGGALPRPAGDREAQRIAQTARERLRRLDAPSALALYREALERDRQSPELHAGLAEALADLGYEDEARRHLDEAARAVAGLPRDRRWKIVAQRLEARGDLDGAAAFLRLAAEAQRAGTGGSGDAERVDLLFRLALTLARAGDGEAALLVLGRPPAAVAADPRGDLVRSEAERSLSRYREQLVSARRAVAGAPRAEAPFLRARGLYLEGEALRRLGDFAESRAALEAARELYAGLGHARGEADVWNTLGNLSWDRQDLAGAKAAYDRAARLYGAIGSQRKRGRVLANHALVLQARGDLAAAVEVFGEALASLEQAGDGIAQAILRVNLASTLVDAGRFAEAGEELSAAAARIAAEREPAIEAFVAYTTARYLILRGDLAGAEARLARADTLLAASGDRSSQANVALYRSLAALHRGEPRRALELQDPALALFGTGEEPPVVVAAILEIRGRALRDAGDPAGAFAVFDRALASEGGGTSSTRLAMAELWIDQGRAGEAVTVARELLAELRASEVVPEAARAYEILVAGLLGAGDLAAARAELEAARQLVEGVESPALHLPLRLLAARLEAAGGDAEAARSGLQSVLAEATSLGFGRLELETGLALAEQEAATGGLRLAQDRLDEIGQEARRRGLGRIAERAARASRPPDGPG